MNGSEWVDFGWIKRCVSLEAVLRWYHVQGLKQRGDQLRGRCPVHDRGAEDAFHVSLSKNIFRCFYCQAQGNVLDFVAVMEHCSIRQAAWILQQHFPVPQAGLERPSQLVPKKEGFNSPLQFALRGLDYGHPYLHSRGITLATARYFGTGFYAGPGLMSGRLAIPIHDLGGSVVAYCGRSVDGTPPRYRLPAGFRKSLELFNLHRAIRYREQTAEVIVVEGFFDCMRVHQAGFPCVVGLMGSNLSEKQQALLLEHFAQIAVMLDGDAPGRSGSAMAARRLANRCHLRTVEVSAHEQPDMLSDDRLRHLLQPLAPASQLVHNANMKGGPEPNKVLPMSPG